MSENVEIACRAFEAANRKPKPDFPTVNALFHRNHELVSLVRLVGSDSDVRGADGFRHWLTETGETYESWESSVEEASALDRERVLLVVTVRARGKQSGAPAEQRLGIVMTLRDEKVARTETYPSSEEALKAVGLRE